MGDHLRILDAIGLKNKTRLGIYPQANFKEFWKFPSDLVVKTLHSQCKGQVRSLVGELRSHMPCVVDKKTYKLKDVYHFYSHNEKIRSITFSNIDQKKKKKCSVAPTQMTRNREGPWKSGSRFQSCYLNLESVCPPLSTPIIPFHPSPFNQTLQRGARRREL